MTTSSSSTDATSQNSQSLLFQNPLYLHPSDGPGTLVVNEKLLGAQNYRSWKRSVEIALSTKRKLGFIRGTVPRSQTSVTHFYTLKTNISDTLTIKIQHFSIT